MKKKRSKNKFGDIKCPPKSVYSNRCNYSEHPCYDSRTGMCYRDLEYETDRLFRNIVKAKKDPKLANYLLEQYIIDLEENLIREVAINRMRIYRRPPRWARGIIYRGKIDE